MASQKLFYTRKGRKYFKNRVIDWIEQGKNEKLILQLQNADPKKLVDSNKISLLHMATKFGNFSIIEFLINKGCDIDATNSYGKTSLMIAMTLTDPTAIKILLNANANLFSFDNTGQYPLQLFFNREIFDSNTLKIIFRKTKEACTNTHEIIQKFIRADCKLVHIICLEDEEITKIFLDQQTVIGPVNEEYAILIALLKFDIDNIKVLLYYGDRHIERRIALFRGFNKVLLTWSDSEECREVTDSIIYVISRWKILNADIVYLVEQLAEQVIKEPLCFILQSDITKYVKNEFGCDLLLHVFGNRNSEVIQWIQSQAIDFYSTSTRSNTGLHIAVKYGVVENVSYLLKAGMNPNVRNEDGHTPIFYIFQIQNNRIHNEECGKLLLLYGANPLLRDNRGKTIIECLQFTERNLINFKTCHQSFVAHFAMLEAHNVPMDLSIKKYLNVFRSFDCYKSFCQQLENLKTFKVCERLTLFHILVANTDEVSRQVNENDYAKIVEVINSHEYHEYYVSVIKKRIKKAVLLKKLKVEAITLVGESIPAFKTYYLILNKIVSYLNDDLFLLFEDYLPQYKQALIKQ